MFLAIEFSTGRIVFTILFIIAFVSAMIFSYKKDKKNNKKHYDKTALFVAIGIITVLGLLFLSKYLVKHYA